MTPVGFQLLIKNNKKREAALKNEAGGDEKRVFFTWPKILGVTLHRRLNFVAHVSEQVKKACAKASALRRIRRFIP